MERNLFSILSQPLILKQKCDALNKRLAEGEILVEVSDPYARNNTEKSPAEMLFRPATFFQLLHDLVHVEAGSLLSLWIFRKGHQELAYIRLRGHQ